jgi:general secretion pathway protein A
LTALRIVNGQEAGSGGPQNGPIKGILPVVSGPAGGIEPLLLGAPRRETGQSKETLERPAGRSGTETRDAAYAALCSQWHMEYAAGEDDSLCEQARAAGLECLAGKGGVLDLRQMNKPAVLTLFDEKGDKYYAALTALSGEVATFRMANETRSVPLNGIAAWWAGDYLLLWRPPLGYKSDLLPGARGGMVSWLANNLAVAFGRSAPTAEATVYDRRMVEQVRQFQLAHGIVPDGIVGPKTIIGLTGVVPGKDPVLQSLQRKG